MFETHAHYDDKAFDPDREELLNSMKENQVSYIVNVGASIETSKKTIELAEKHPFIYGAIGVHPSETAELNEEKLQWLKENSKEEKIVAIGEIGLDYYWEEPTKEIQHNWFSKQLQLAHEVNLPVIIHSRDAAKDTIDIMRSNQAERLNGIIHCYSYSKETARDFLNMDYYFGIGGVITFNNAKKLVEAVEYIPIDKILLETDCPYLAPMPYRGKRNSSVYLSYIATKIAQIKGITYETVVEETCKNAKKLYRIK